MKKMIIFDGNSILNRAFYGIKHLSTKDGFPTNALFGFINTIIKNMDAAGGGFDYAAIAYDMRAKTFRHEACETYKATRKGMPEDLFLQLPLSKDIAAAMGLHVLEREGYEADDIVGTLSRIASENDIHAYIVSGDRDCFQLINDNVTVILQTNTEAKLTDTAQINEIYSLSPKQLIDLKAIMGDSSDNIKGVAGIGEKGALSLMQEFGSLDNIYNGLDKIKDSLKIKLEASKDEAYMSRFLAEINKHVPVSENPGDYLLAERNDEALISIFTKLEFSSLANKLDLKEKTKKQDTLQEIEIKPDELSKLGDSELFVDIEDDFFHIYSDNGLFKTAVNETSLSLFTTGRKVTFWSIKEVNRRMLEAGLEIDCNPDDVSLLAYLVAPVENDITPQRIVSMYLGLDEVQCLAPLLPELKVILSGELLKIESTFLYKEIELPLALLLAECEHYGFSVDKNALEAYSDVLGTKIKELEQSIYMLAGQEFNINSPKQLGSILFDSLNLPHGKKTKTGYSTNVEVLDKLKDKHPIIDNILFYRTLSKLKSTYADGLLKVISDKDGRIHTTFKQTFTKTGRLSSIEPNLQNIPVRTELGRELRKFFIAPEGRILVDADYSQIELRILAHISGDRKMIDAFKNGIDIHTITAGRIFNVPESAVTPEMRKKAKAVNFGIVYGISDFALAEDIGVTKKEAGEYIKSYLSNYPMVAQYLNDIQSKAKEDGYVTTMYGRRRYISELKSNNKIVIAAGERIAMNTPIQGTAADIIKKAMVDTAKELKKHDLDARIILQIHDELIIEAVEKDAEKAKELLVDCMENAFTLELPISVDASIGRSWYLAKEG